MRMTAAGYGAIVGSLSHVARRHGALALVTEGGYDLGALEECLEASIAAVAADGAAAERRLAPAPRGERAVAAVRAALQGVWSSDCVKSQAPSSKSQPLPTPKSQRLQIPRVVESVS